MTNYLENIEFEKVLGCYRKKIIVETGKKVYKLKARTAFFLMYLVRKTQGNVAYGHKEVDGLTLAKAMGEAIKRERWKRRIEASVHPNHPVG